MTDLTVNVTKIINASIEKVFDAWLNPETLSQFILPMPGMPQPQTETDAREGGSFTIIMQVGGDKISHTGKYLEISRPNKLVFTWESPFSTDGSTVTLNFSDLGENKTNVELTQIKFIDEESRANHEGGWDNILTSLNNVFG
ncbi:MAG: SRPBCC domain-containing protein [Gammaproteobacteria bacterium]|nr:SRPBCC domain-containing protein [Gammaproteobacteria bacterium]